MPVTQLFVEGKLDKEFLAAILAGRPLVVRAGSKGSLGPRTRDAREREQKAACHLRDRDFDFDPPADVSRPIVDQMDPKGNNVLGYRWCRHELENYLLEPAFVARAFACQESAYVEALCNAAKSIRHYQAARWAVGCARPMLLPPHKLNTRPDLGEIALPPDLTKQACRDWVGNHAEDFGNLICPGLKRSALHEGVERYRAQLSDERLASPQGILLWCSGKDLLAALTEWVRGKGCQNPGDARTILKDWIRDNPTEALRVLPEWNAFVEDLRK